MPQTKELIPLHDQLELMIKFHELEMQRKKEEAAIKNSSGLSSSLIATSERFQVPAV